MLTSYQDIIDKLGEPEWYDESGVPRYVPFRPEECGVYINACALLEIECQECSNHFKVACVLDSNGMQAALLIGRCYDLVDKLKVVDDDAVFTAKALMESLKVTDEFREIPRPTGSNPGWVGWGDPPNHGCVGDTMGAWEVRILEYWERGRETVYDKTKASYRFDVERMNADGYSPWEWYRYQEHEIEINESPGI